MVELLSGTRSRSSAGVIVYMTLLFSMGTLLYAGDFATSTQAYVDNREFPGGPAAYVDYIYSKPLFSMTNASFIIEVWLSDALMVSIQLSTITPLCNTRYLKIYRLFIVYGYNYLIIVLPALLWLSSFCEF